MATTLDFEDEGGDDTSSVTICSTSSIHPQTMHYNNRKLEANASSCNNCCAAIIDHHHRHNPHDINNEAAIEKTTVESQHKDRSMDDDCNENMGCGSTIDNVGLVNQVETAATIVGMKTASQRQQPPHLQQHVVSTQPEAQIASNALSVNKNLLLCRRFKDSGDTLRNFNSLPLFVYATSPSTHAVSADGVGVAKVAVKAAEEAAKVDGNDLAQHGNNINFTYLANNFDGNILRNPMDCIPLAVGGGSHHPHLMASSNTVNVTVASAAVAAGSGYSHHPNLNANPLHQHHHHLLSHNTAYANSYAIHHGVGNGNHHHIHSEQTKSLQELQHEVGALLEFRDLVIETFPDLKQKMASMSSAASTTSNTGGLTNGGQSVGSVISAAGSTATLTSGGTLVSRREWEPGIRIKRKISQKETSQPAATELSSSSLTRSRSNSHSGKKEPKSSSGGGSSANGGGSGENNNGSVIQDSGFSTETSSSKEGHSASSTNGASTGAIASNRLSCPESDDELLNLLDVIHRKSNRLRDEVEHLQNYERQQLRQQSTCSSEDQLDMNEGAAGISKSSSSSANTALTPKTFREHVERLSKEDIKQLRRERDRLLDKLAEMEAETLTGRIKAAKMNDQVEELTNVKKELEEQLKLAMAQKLELSSRIQQLQQQQQQPQSKTPLRLNHQDRSSQIIGLCSSANTVVSTVSTISQTQTDFVRARQQNTFQPLVVDNQQQQQQQQMLPFSSSTENSQQNLIPFHQSSDTTTKRNQQQPQQFSVDQLGRLDGIISTPGSRANKCRVTDSKRFAAILLETSVIELQRQLLTLTVQNQVLTQKLEQASKSKSHLVKRLDKTKDDVEDLRFQLEEKNIELEGTKAQLRVLESRLHSTTPNSGAGINSYLHSHQDYETNRSSASTTLMMSRRDGSEIRSQTPLTSSCGQMPQPVTTQISTPSMKAMVPLPMDELQHNSSSTESAHDHELQLDANNKSMQRDTGGLGILSISVGGISPFEKQQQQQQEQKQQHQQQITALRNQVQALKKFSGGTTKPSKIPLPGSKAAAYFAGKPPTGRPSTAGRSPPSVNSSTSSNRSPLSRSTGNLLYSKSPNSLKRTDSAQSIRKDNNHNSSSLSTNTSRSSTSSSIPLATTPYGSTPKSTISYNTNNNNNNTPSSRVLQNSPLPKPKRESLSTRVKHMDSLSRAYNQLQQNHSNNNDGNTSTTVVATSTAPSGGDKAASSCVSSTPKAKTVTSQLTSSLRKDLQLSSSSFSHGSQAFPRRATGGITFNNTNPTTTRRFSSASVVGARMAAARQAETDLQNTSNINGGSSANTAAGAQASSSSSGHGASGGGGNGTASDSDSGKKETKAGTLNFSSFKSSFTSNVNFLKRRFSSGDLSSEADDVDPNTLPPAARPIQDQPTKPASVASSGGPPNVPPPPAPNTTQSTTQEFSLNLGSGGKAAASTTATSAVPPRGVSAPTSPAKSRESLLQRVQSLTGAARDQGASILGAAVQSATRAPAFNKDKYITLLVLDDHNTDWSKYFRGKRLHGDYDIRVEQAEFRDVTLHASADSGPVITMEVHRGDSRIPRMFRPDFVLIRQPPRDGANDYRSTILGLKYGGVPSINSLNSVYQFQDKPWVFAHLQQLQRRLGKDVFPLIEQTFFPSPKYLLNWTKFPCVLKAGHCHGGMATARFENQSALQDAAGLVTGTGSEGHCYCTIEPYIDAKFDIHIQKIGNNYKAFMRKSITGNWKTNQGSAMLEQITLTDKYKSWVDEVSEMFGGMEVCGLSLVVGRDGREHIIKASDSTFALMGDTQEDDRRQIADLVTSRMQNVCRPGAGQIQGKITARSSVSSLTGSPTDESGAPPPAPAGPRPAPMGGPPPIPERTSPAVGSIGRLTSRSSISEVPEETTATAVAPASVAPSTDSKAQSDLDIIFGSSTKYNRASSDAELIFGTPLSYKSERFGSSKSMSVASDNSYGYNPGSNATTGGGNAYKIYEGIQNAAFTDFADSPASQIKSKIDKKLSGITDDEDDLDLK